MSKVRIGLIGGGLISEKHINASKEITNGELVALCDADPEKKCMADELGIPFFTDFQEMITQTETEGIIDATPNQLHAKIGMACAERGVHVLTEKPIASTLEDGKKLVNAVKESGINLLVGHHRRHFPLVKRAKEIVESGELGQVIGVSLIWALMKPDFYFDVAWRSQKGGGPVLINIIHEIDNLRYICGDVAELSARAKRLVRTGEVEDTISLNFEMANGALGSGFISDTTPSPWSYELAAGENDHYFCAGQDCYRFFGTEAALSFPNMEVWRHPHGTEKGWYEPLTKRTEKVPYFAPFTAQLEHFCNVIKGSEKPIIDAADGLMTLATTLAVLESSETGRPVNPAELLDTK